MSKIYGIALTPDGEPVPGVDVEVAGPGDEVLARHTTGEDGIFEFEVEAGSFNLRWTAPSGDSGDGTVQVAEGEDSEIELEIPS